MGGDAHGGHGHGHGHGHHAPSRYGFPPGYEGWPKDVWSPTGGWYCNPVKWRRNTALTMLGIVLVCIPIARFGIEREEYPFPAVRPVPSDLWVKPKNVGPPLYADQPKAASD